MSLPLRSADRIITLPGHLQYVTYYAYLSLGPVSSVRDRMHRWYSRSAGPGDKRGIGATSDRTPPGLRRRVRRRKSEKTEAAWWFIQPNVM